MKILNQNQLRKKNVYHILVVDEEMNKSIYINWVLFKEY